MTQLTELYVGPDNSGQLDITHVKEVLKKHRLQFNLKEQAWMQWDEDLEIGLVLQVEDNTQKIHTVVNDLRQSLGIERVSVLYPGDLVD